MSRGLVVIANHRRSSSISLRSEITGPVDVVLGTLAGLGLALAPILYLLGVLS